MIEMGKCSFGVTFLQNLEDSARWARFAEEKGFDFLLLADSPVVSDVYINLTLCAMNTSRIKLGTGVLTPLTRHPATNTGSMMTLNELSKGRAILGIGTGYTSAKMLGLKPASIARMRRTVKLMRELIHGAKEADFDGQKVQFPVEFKAEPKVPIWVVARGPRMMQLAGEVGDGAMIFAGVSPNLIQFALDNVRKGAKAAGRDPDRVEIIWHGATSISPTRERALADVKPWVSSLPHAFASASLEGMPQEVVDAAGLVKTSYDYGRYLQKDVEYDDETLLKLADNFSLWGTPDDLVEKIKRIEAMGISKFDLAMYSPKLDKRQFMEDFSAKVSPHFA